MEEIEEIEWSADPSGRMVRRTEALLGRPGRPTMTKDTAMFSFSKIAAAAAGMALVLSATPGFAGSPYAITVINKTSKDIWITWYIGPNYVNGQAGTSCVHPGASAVGDDAADWKSGDGTVVRAELKAGSNCGGKTLNYDGSSAGQKVYRGAVAQNGNMKITITANGNNLSGSVGY